MNFSSILLILPVVLSSTVASGGLPNVGNTCYLNTGLQAIASIPRIPELVLNAKLTKEGADRSLLRSLKKLFRGMQDATNAPSASLMRRIAKKATAIAGIKNPFNMQDMTEPWRALMNNIPENLLSPKAKTEFDNLVRFVHKRNSFTGNHNSLVMYAHQSASLEDGFSNLSDGTSDTRMICAPPVLNVQISRVMDDNVTKSQNPFAFPQKINIKKHLASSTDPDALKALPECSTKDTEYVLRYVAYHSGSTATSGHWYGIRAEDSEGKKYVEVNDSQVSEFTQSLKKFETGVSLLVYVRKDKWKAIVGDGSYKVPAVDSTAPCSDSEDESSGGSGYYSGGSGGSSYSSSSYSSSSSSGSTSSSSSSSSGGSSSSSGSPSSSSSSSGGSSGGKPPTSNVPTSSTKNDDNQASQPAAQVKSPVDASQVQWTATMWTVLKWSSPIAAILVLYLLYRVGCWFSQRRRLRQQQSSKTTC